MTGYLVMAILVFAHSKEITTIALQLGLTSLLLWWGLLGWESVSAAGILSSSIGSTTGVGQESTLVDVLDGVTSLVVVGVVGDASGTTVHFLLSLSFDTFGTGEETTSGDVLLDESIVVGAAGEGSWVMGLA